MEEIEGLVTCEANYIPLSPISFLERARFVHQDRLSIVYKTQKYSWKETYERCIKLASALSKLQIASGNIVAALAPNIPALYELHFGVPMAGAILCALNTSLNATTLALKLDQLQAKVVFVDYHYIEVVHQAINMMSPTKNKPLLVSIHESIEEHNVANYFDYEGLIAMGNADFGIVYPKDERNPISINYTSGSTGKPKGVVYSHRAVYLNSLAMIFRTEMRQKPVFLWTVDMFRCNGWCFPWVMAALGGTNICIRNVRGEEIFKSIANHNVTHFVGAPAILKKILETPVSHQQGSFRQNVNITIAGSLPPQDIVQRLERLGFVITHGYGMSEALGPIMVKPCNDCDNSDDEEFNIEARDGIHNLLIECVDVKDPSTMKSVPPDGKTIGEIMLRSNTMMLGYMRNSKATQEAFKGGWYRTKDVGVRCPNGCIEMKDRLNDIIVCADEVISSLEIEAILVKHPMVLEAAVVGKPHHLLGEIPCAFVKLKEESLCVSVEEVIKFCETNLPHSNMVPHNVIFGDLPVNSTGKVQKFILKDKAKIIDE